MVFFNKITSIVLGLMATGDTSLVASCAALKIYIPHFKTHRVSIRRTWVKMEGYEERLEKYNLDTMAKKIFKEFLQKHQDKPMFKAQVEEWKKLTENFQETKLDEDNLLSFQLARILCGIPLDYEGNIPRPGSQGDKSWINLSGYDLPTANKYGVDKATELYCHNTGQNSICDRDINDFVAWCQWTRNPCEDKIQREFAASQLRRIEVGIPLDYQDPGDRSPREYTFIDLD